ncbi:vacuolar protein sorting-associated 13b-like protein, partial [Nannochloropsis gaditana CCMP526]
AFLKGILSNYVADAIFRSPALLGSLEIIGSPAILVSRVVSGLKDLVMLSASGSLTGAGRGLLSLTRHVVGGTLASLAGFSSSVRRNLEPGERVRGGQPHGIHDAHFHRRSGSVEFSGNGGTRAGKGEEGRRLSLPAGLDVGG